MKNRFKVLFIVVVFFVSVSLSLFRIQRELPPSNKPAATDDRFLKPPFLSPWLQPGLSIKERSRLAAAEIEPGSSFADAKSRLGSDGTLARYHGVRISLLTNSTPGFKDESDFQQWRYEYKFDDGAVVLVFENSRNSPTPESRISSVSWSKTLPVEADLVIE